MPEENNFNRKSIEELIQFMERNKGHFAFLIGAGTSKAADIPTSKELIEEWQKEKYKREGGNLRNKRKFKEWIKKKEKEMKKGESRYGFWFEQVCPTREERRQYIRSLVEGKEPSFGIIVLASMMEQGYCPVVLTPNFDDLLYDAFYLFLEKRPLLINHDALAPEFRFTGDRATIIKLHGDYLYDNLKNLGDETKRLTENMEFALNECLREYGLIVVGYGGRDESIMNVLKKADPSYGIWWCTTNEKSLSEYAKEFLQKSNNFLVKIKDAEEFFTTLWSKLGVQIPSPDKIKERAEKRAETLRMKISERKGKAKGKEKRELEKIEEFFKYLFKAGGFYDKKDYKKAIEYYDKALRINPRNADTWYSKGVTLYHLGKYEEAIKCYDKALEINPRDVDTYQNRAELLIIVGRYEEGLEDAQQSLKYAKDKEGVAVALMLSIVAKTMLDKKITEEEKYRKLCSEGFTTTWDFSPLESWLNTVDIPKKKKDYIKEIIELLKKHTKI
ncbi:MAG: tetratricopeptide repeat protein [Thermoplasmata archaeon]|nr:MAG: tetratricopeptide repeat protein [Thermoplasmata archaeon]